MCFDIKNVYLDTPIHRPKYAHIHLKDIPQEFITKYNLTTYARDVWVYFRIFKGVYGIPQADKIADNLLRKRLATKGYYEAATTPGLWLHKWRPIIFCLTADDFGIEYVGKQHTQYLLFILQEHYTVTTDWEGKKYEGLDLEGNYKYRTRQSPWGTTSGNYFSDMPIQHYAKHSVHPTIIAKLYTAQASRSH